MGGGKKVASENFQTRPYQGTIGQHLE